MTTNATAPTTKAPISFGLARFTALLLSVMASGLTGLSGRLGAHGSAGEKRPHLRIGAGIAQVLGIPAGDHGFAVGIEKDRIVADGEDARQLVRHHYDGGAQTIAQLEDQLIQQP